MVVIIDGYNLLKQVWPGVKTSMEKHRNHFIAELSYFKKQKPDITEIIVVFDAGPLTHATREIKGGIVVVFSGVKSSADDWITHFVERNKMKEILVVTLDRELSTACKKAGADVMGVFDFYEILQHNLFERVSQGDDIHVSTGIEKYEHGDDMSDGRVDPKALDLLMQQATLAMPKEKDGDSDQKKKLSGKGYTPSKKEKRLAKKLKKLF